MTTDRTLEGIGRFDWERIFERVPTGTAGIKPTTKCVGWVLARYAEADTGARIWPGRKRLAAVVGKSLRTIDSALDELCDVGLIEVVRKGGRGTGGKGYATEYRLTLPDDLVRRMTLLDLDGTGVEVTSVHQLQPVATDGGKKDADQSQHIATDEAEQSQFSADQSQLSHSSVATLEAISRNGLHPINHSYINHPFINEGTSAGYVTNAREDNENPSPRDQSEDADQMSYEEARDILVTLQDFGERYLALLDEQLKGEARYIAAAQLHLDSPEKRRAS